MDKYIIKIDGTFKIADDKGVREIKEGESFKVTNVRKDERTIAQNSAMHLYFNMLADALNDAGYDMSKYSSIQYSDRIIDGSRHLKKNIPKEYHSFIDEVAKSQLQPTFEKLPFSMNAVKETIWREIQIALTGKESTTDLSKKEDIDMIYLAVNQAVKNKTGVTKAFPSIENMLMERQLKEMRL